MSQVHAHTIRHSRFVNQAPVYYGWVILLMGTLGMIMTSPGQTYAVSIFIEYFITDLGISRSMVSTLYTIGTLGGSFALPLVGRQIDRRGPRIMMTLIAFFFGLACIYMGFVGGAIMLGLGFFLIRMLGQGSLALVSNNVMNQWWVRRRGTVIGLSGMLVALFGFGFMPTFINWLIPRFGWQSTYMILGIVLVAIFAPLAYMLVRDKPENYGLQPDGFSPVSTPAGEQERHANEVNWTLPEARKTAAFWLMVLGMASISMLATGLFFHMVSIFNDNGLDAATAAWVFAPIAMTSALVNFGGGMLVDRVPVRFLLAAALFLQAVSLLLALFLQGPEMAFFYGIIMGMTMGLMGTVNGTGLAIYFGRKYLGSITGVTATILVLGSALGPMPFGIARDWLGNYTLVLTLCALIPFTLAVANLFVPQPTKSE